jgi:hypothetical protein
MLKIRLVANNPDEGTPKELEIEEREWRPARSLMAIANQKVKEREGRPVIWFDSLENIDENVGGGIQDDDLCIALAKEMKELMSDPFEISDYGMSVDLDNGVAIYTYPVEMCTAFFEDEDGKFYETLESPGIVGKRVKSWFRTDENQMNKIVDFLLSCGGFSMP